jgi:hypothetical protein
MRKLLLPAVREIKTYVEVIPYCSQLVQSSKCCSRAWLFLFSENTYTRDYIKRGEGTIMPRLFVGNLGHDCRAKDIEKFFKSFGPVRYELRNFQSNGARICACLMSPGIDSARLGIDSLKYTLWPL